MLIFPAIHYTLVLALLIKVFVVVAAAIIVIVVVVRRITPLAQRYNDNNLWCCTVILIKHVYLQEEIGEVFDQWQNSRKPSASIPIPANKKTPPVPPPRRSKNHDFTDWSEGLLAEFNNIIAQELNQLEANHAVTAGDMRLRITRSRSWENNDTDASGTPPSSYSATDAFSGCSPSLHHRALGLARALRRHRSPLIPEDPPGDAVLVKVSTLPDADVMFVATSERDDACTTFPHSESAGALARLEHMDRQNNSIPETATPPREDVMVSRICNIS